MWDTLNTEYGGSDVSTKLYIIEQYHDYQMVDGKSVVTQAHEIQCMVKELRLLKIVAPDEFVAGDIIAKLHQWKEDEGCFMCGSLDHWAKKCPNLKGRKPQPE
jgi:hypothetical protein